MSNTIRVIIAGSTGAIGHNLVQLMLRHPRCTHITALSRREIPRDQWRSTWPGDWTDEMAAKLEVKAIDWDRLLADEEAKTIAIIPQWQDMFHDHNWVVMAMGPVYTESGSIANHRKYNFDYVRALIAAVKTHCGPCYYSQISGQGCNSNSWFETLRIKGEANDLANAEFSNVSIFKPGLLDRADKNRTWEKIFGYVLSNTKVSDIASALINDYEEYEKAAAEAKTSSTELVRRNVYDVKEINTLAGHKKSCCCTAN